MAILGIGNTYSNAYESMYASSKKEVTEKQEGTAGKKYANAEEYYDYLKNKYECLNAKNYKVTISPAYLEKCVKDPEKAELLEKNLAHLPVSHQNMTAFWSAKGARVVNEQWNFDENGNCGGSPNMYVTNSNSSSGSSVQDKKIEKKAGRKSTPQNYYDKRKYLREQFEKKQAEKKQLREQLEERQEEKEMYAKLQEKSDLSRKQNAGRVIERYEASVLKS